MWRGLVYVNLTGNIALEGFTERKWKIKKSPSNSKLVDFFLENHDIEKTVNNNTSRRSTTKK